jgi:phosphatidylethanolamine-binding protein (PEBP) family uncharacterized protein
MKIRSSSLATLLALTMCAAIASCGSDDDPPPSGTGGAGTGGRGGAGGSASGGSGGGTGGGTGGSVSTGGSPGSGGGTGGAGSGGSGGAPAGSGGSSGDAAGGETTGSGGSAGDAGGGETGGAGEFTLTSPDFLMISNNRLCHKKEQTSSGSQTSPGLSWSGLPAGTQSIAVSLKDRMGGTHWVMWNIPPTVTSLPRDINAAMKPEGSSNSGNWYGPGAGLPHRTYEYRVWAMKGPMLPGGCGGKACYPNALMTNSIAYKELLVVGTAAGTCPN